MIWKTLQRNLRSAAAIALAAVCCSTMHSQSGVATRRITAAVNNSDRVAMAGSTLASVVHATDLGPASTSLVARHMAMVLSRTDAQQTALNQYLRDVQNPQSTSFRKWLTPEEFGDRFGASSEDVQTLGSWLASQGLTVEKIAPARNVIFFSGTVGQVQTAFGTEVHALTVNGQRHIANVTATQLPRAFASVVKGVMGIDDFRTQSHVIRSSGAAHWDAASQRIQPDLTLSNGDLYVDPADAATIYDVPNANLNPAYKGSTYDGTGITVGIVGDSNFTMAPVQNYRTAFLGETTSTVNLPNVIIDGSDPGVNGDSVESYLDVEVLGGLAPKAKINYYTSAGSDLSDPLFDSITRAINDNQISILSISYGGCEAELGTSTNLFINETYQQAAAQGITVVVSTGDSGSAGCDSASATTATGGLAVSGLSSTPYNVAVGGTDFPALAASFTTYAVNTSSGTAPYYLTAKSYIPERPWNDSSSVDGLLSANVPYASANIVGGTGGKSSIYPKPDFQTALTPADSQRDVPDVSFLAGNGLYDAAWVLCEYSSIYGNECANTNGVFGTSSVFAGAGGTSAATPAFAAMLALLEQSVGSRLGMVNETLYRLAGTKYSTVFHDVLAGNNAVVCKVGALNCGSNGFLTGYNATTGFDLASGLGSVDAAAMVANWTSGEGTISTTGLTVNGSTAAVSAVHGTSLNFGVTVKPGTTATGTAGIVNNATQTSGSQTLNGSPLATLQIAGGAGTLSYNGLPGGTYSVYANYTGDVNNYGSQSNLIPVTITAEDGSTQLSVSAYTATGAPYASLTAVPYGSYVIGHASVYGTKEGFDASLGYGVGSFTFLDNGKSVGTAVNSTDNFATFPAITSNAYPYAVGTHTLTATWPGDASYKANTSNSVNVTIVQAPTTIVATPQVATISSLITDAITVNVNTTGTGLAPTGTVTLTTNGKTIGTSTSLISQTSLAGATFGTTVINVTGSAFVQGTNTITATYSGDANYGASTSTFTLYVNVATFSITAGSISTSAGATTGNTSTLTVAPSGSFAGVVNLSCAVTSAPANAVSPATCSVPASVNLTGTTSTTGTLTVNSTATTTGGAYTVTITGVDAATGNIKASGTATVTIAAVPTFTLSNSGAVTVTAGATTGNTSTVTVTPANGFTGAVTTSCAVTTTPASANKPITCSLSASTVTISGTAAGTTVLSIASTATTTTTASLRGTQELHQERMLRGFGGTALAFTVLCCVPLRRRRFGRLLLMVAMVGSFGAMIGCGSSSSSNGGGSKTTTVPGTTAGAYVVTVTATSGTLTQTNTVNVTVN